MCVLFKPTSSAQGKRVLSWIPGRLVLISGGETSFVWPVSGVIRAWGRRQGSKGGLFRS